MSHPIHTRSCPARIDYTRGDGPLATIRLREKIRRDSDGFVAEETTLCRDLTPLEVVTQFDSLIESARLESMADQCVDPWEGQME